MSYKLLLTGIFATTLVLAQGRGGGGGDEGGGMGGGSRAGGESGGIQMPRVVSRMDQISEALKLNKEQKKEVKTILDEGQKEAGPVREQLMKSQLAIGEAIQGGKSQDDLKPLVNGEAALQAQMVGIELNAFAKIYKLLAGGVLRFGPNRSRCGRRRPRGRSPAGDPAGPTQQSA